MTKSLANPIPNASSVSSSNLAGSPQVRHALAFTPSVLSGSASGVLARSPGPCTCEYRASTLAQYRRAAYANSVPCIAERHTLAQYRTSQSGVGG
eukprot:447945-Rhodomonas_salina.3